MRGKRAFPFVVTYTASKFALEGYSYALRRELLLYGIDVILIEPGPIKTTIWDKASSEEDNPFKKSDYNSILKQFYKITMKRGKKGLNAKLISKQINKIINFPRPKIKHVIILKNL